MRSRAYQAGYDSFVNGANTTNCHFSIFATVEGKNEWERGRADAESEGAVPRSEPQESIVATDQQKGIKTMNPLDDKEVE